MCEYCEEDVSEGGWESDNIKKGRISKRKCNNL